MSGFKKFLLRGNVVELAVAIVMGLAFVALVGAFVDAFITPLLGLLFGGGELQRKGFAISGTRFRVGAFLSQLLTFLGTAAAVYFLIVVPVQRVLARRQPEADPTVRECAECLSAIPVAARRCSFCTSVQAG